MILVSHSCTLIMQVTHYDPFRPPVIPYCLPHMRYTYICISHIQTVALYQLLTMTVLYSSQTIELPFHISKSDNLYQPYRCTEYNVCDDTCESDLNDHFGKIFPDCKYHSAYEFNTCNRNPLCLPGASFQHVVCKKHCCMYYVFC